MKKPEIGQAINTLANLGVIAGIIFLAVEVHQNNELLQMEARATLSEYNQNAWDRVSSSPELVEIFIKDRNNQELSESEEMRISAFWMGYLLRLEFQFLHSPDQFSRTQALKRIQAAYPSFRRTWNGNTSGARAAGKDSFDPEFVRFIDDLVAAGP